MKSKKISYIISSVSMFAFLLTGCGKKEVEPSRVNRGDYTNDYFLVSTKGEGRKALPFSTVDYFDEEGNYKPYKQVNNVRVLVVPVDFTDFPASSLPNGEEGAKEDIEKVHFGEASETSWNSLSSYYKSTSFGTANITGVVTDWYHTNMSVKEFAKYGGGSTNATQQLALDIQNYFTEGDGASKIDLKDFDANKDGYVDATVMIYSCPDRVTVANQPVDNDLYWAFATVRGGAFGRVTRPAVYNYFWASINTFYEAGHYSENGTWSAWTKDDIKNGTVKVDAHTLIHEFGHVLGLPDYYSYDANSGKSDYYPFGGIDMMDFNIGDHNAMSKAWYGWVEPYIVTDSTTITINSTTLTGDAILIPAGGNYKNTLIDQFIMIELLTPDGVAVFDGKQQLHGSGMGTYPYFYNEIGIRVSHVDARMGLFVHNSQTNSYQFSNFTASYTNVQNQYVGFANDNTKSRSSFPDYRFLELLPSDGVPMKNKKGNATNDYLFKEGQTFGGNSKSAVFKAKDFKMNGIDGNKTVDLGFSFTIKQIDKENKTATISFKKL